VCSIEGKKISPVDMLVDHVLQPRSSLDVAVWCQTLVYISWLIIPVLATCIYISAVHEELVYKYTNNLLQRIVMHTVGKLYTSWRVYTCHTSFYKVHVYDLQQSILVL